MVGGWAELGMVDTIYEEEHEELSNCHTPLTPSPTSTSIISCLNSRVETWSKATEMEADILVHVHGRCFKLHKDPLMSRSRYFERKLTESTYNTVYVQSCITEETFALVACFCYNSEVVITPLNVIPLRVAAELLEMYDDSDVDRNLRQITETYFCQAVSVNGEYAALILRSCLALLPEAEETAFLVSRSIEALVMTDKLSNIGLIDGVKSMTVEEFQMVADSMKGRFQRNHDLLYKVVDIYLKEHKHNLTEVDKNRICCSVDCNKLSQPLLMHAVQNLEMPLRFVIRATLVEQLNTRRSKPYNNCATLGAILHRDAALRHTSQLKATMDATSARIISLEHELICLKKRLHESENKREASESARSSSCRFSWERNKGGMSEKATTSPPLEIPCSTASRTSKSLSRKLVSGLKNVFRAPKTDFTV